jgi:hypothetical protein
MVTLNVGHNDRKIEFFMFKKKLDQYIRATYEDRCFDLSCEQIAEDLLVHFRAKVVTVGEDGENAASVTASNRALMLRPRCFLGTELEGPFKGARTLFIPGGVSVPEALSALRKVEQLAGRSFVQRIYCGAGNRHGVGLYFLDQILKEAKRCRLQVDIELDSPLLARNTCEFLSMLPHQKQIGAVVVVGPFYEVSDYFKKIIIGRSFYKQHLYQKQILKDNIVWHKVFSSELWSTWLYHPGFDQDVEIKL